MSEQAKKPAAKKVTKEIPKPAAHAAPPVHKPAVAKPAAAPVHPAKPAAAPAHPAKPALPKPAAHAVPPVHKGPLPKPAAAPAPAARPPFPGAAPPRPGIPQARPVLRPAPGSAVPPRPTTPAVPGHRPSVPPAAPPKPAAAPPTHRPGAAAPAAAPGPRPGPAAARPVAAPIPAPRPGAPRPPFPSAVPHRHAPAAPRPAPPKPGPQRPVPPAPKPPAPKPAPAPPAPPKPRVKISLREGWRLRDAAEAMKVRPKDLLEMLTAKGFPADLDDFVDAEVAAAVTKATHFDADFITLDQALRLQAESQAADISARAPVVTIMGHVDHGKTTLLDAIRSSNLVDKESGGITQHIGAYRVAVRNRFITFIDTPGHEAFTQLRARGAKVTDIVVLVVAADDGVMPQTKEAIDHARAANVSIIVAINKIDRPEANVDRVKQQLAKENLLVEDWGGKTISVDISAKDKKNIGDLLEMILLLSDILEVKANPKASAQGVVLEARLDSQRGPVATVIVQQGTLLQGQAFVSGLSMGKVRAMFDEKGHILKSAGPSMPVEIMGFADVPAAGDAFLVMEDPAAAKQVVEFRKSRVKSKTTPRETGVTLDELFAQIEGGQAKELALVLKADVQGSIEVLNDIVPPLGTEKVKVKVVHAATGNITEADILLASASKAIVIGYNVKPNPKILDLAKKEGVEIRTYKIIYELTDDIKKAAIGLLEPVVKETYQGRAEVRRLFQIPKVGMIAGCYVQDGRITRNAEARVLRGREVLFEGRVTSLKHLKENVTEVKKDYECGIGLGGFNDLQPGDTIEVFIREKVKAV